MNPATVDLIMRLVALLLSTGPAVVAEIIKIRELLKLSPDIEANLKMLFDTTIVADQNTLDDANAWLAAHGYPTVQP